MYLIDSRDTLSFAREHASRLRDDNALIRRAAGKRRFRVQWIRRHACRCQIDTAPLAHRPA